MQVDLRLSDPKLRRPDDDKPVFNVTVSYEYEATGNQREWITESFLDLESGEDLEDPSLGRKVVRSFYPAGLLRERRGVKPTAEGDLPAATSAETVLPGHGEPWPHGVKSAVEIARRTG